MPPNQLPSAKPPVLPEPPAEILAVDEKIFNENIRMRSMRQKSMPARKGFAGRLGVFASQHRLVTLILAGLLIASPYMFHISNSLGSKVKLAPGASTNGLDTTTYPTDGSSDRVDVVGSEDNSGSGIQVEPGLLQLSAPENIQLHFGSTSLKASWQSITGATQYQLSIATNAGLEHDRVITSGAAELTVPGLLAKTRYYVRVRAVSSRNMSDWSVVKSGVTAGLSSGVGKLALPGKVSGIQVSVTSPRSVSLHWQPASGAQRYTVIRAQNSDMSIAKKEYAAVTGTNYKLSDLSPGTRYYFVVQASNDRGYGAKSVPVSAKTHMLTPAIFSSTVISSNSLRIAWQKVIGADGYTVQASPSVTFVSPRVVSLSGDNTTFSGLQSGTIYYIRVRATDSSYVTPWSSVVKVRTAVAIPSGLKLLSASFNLAKVSWAQTRGATGYIISYSKSPSMSPSYSIVLNTNTATLTGLQQKTTYYVRVLARDGTRSTGWSPTIHFATSPYPSFVLGSFNIYYSSDKSNYTYSITQYLTRLSRSASVIKKYHIQVAGLQEVRQNQFQHLLDGSRLGSGYGIYPKTYAAGGYASQNPIVWDKTRFSLVDTGTKTIAGPHVGADGWFSSSNTQVKLRDKLTGKTFYVINTHETVGTDSADAKSRYVSAKNRVTYLTALAKQGIPIFMTGDYNSHDYMPQPQPVYGGSFQNTAYCLFANKTTQLNALDALVGKTGCRQRKGSSVDHVYLSRGIQVLRYDYSSATARSNGSDTHNTLMVTVRFP